MVVSHLFRQIHVNTFRQHCQILRQFSKKPPKSEFQADREKYLAFEREWEKNVNYNLLSPLEIEIHLKHKEAVGMHFALLIKFGTRPYCVSIFQEYQFYCWFLFRKLPLDLH